MDAHEHVLPAVDVALHERDVVLAGERLLERDGGELAVGGRHADGRGALDELLGAAPVLDQVGDGDHQELVPLAVLDQVGNAGHRAVLVRDLADDARGIQPCEPGEVDGRLGLAGALEDAAGARAQRKDVAGPDEVARALARVDRDLDRPGAVVHGDPGGDPVARLDRDRERGAVGRLVPCGHRVQLELVAAIAGEAEADEPAAVRGHEVDRLGRRELRRDGQVALVLAVGGVDDHDELALADGLDRLLDGGEGGLWSRVRRLGHRRNRNGVRPRCRGLRAGGRRAWRGHRPRRSPRRPARARPAWSPRACAARARSRPSRGRGRRS